MKLKAKYINDVRYK